MLSTEQVVLLLEILGRELDNAKVKTNNALFKLYIRILLQAQEQGVDIARLKI